jgi:uncharacterized coiled-coil protein SlyX
MKKRVAYQVLMTLGMAAMITFATTLAAVAQEGGAMPPPADVPEGAMFGPGPGNGHPGREGMRQGPMPMIQQWADQLKTENPEEFERLMKLRDENPEAFRQQIRERLGQRMGRGMRSSAEEGQVGELVQKYHQAQTEQEKEELKAQIQEAVTGAFGAQMAEQKEMIARMQQRLTEFRERLATREENREAIIENRVEQLTTEPELRW